MLFVCDIIGALGRSLDTGLLFVNVVARFFVTPTALGGATMGFKGLVTVLLPRTGVLNGVFTIADTTTGAVGK